MGKRAADMTVGEKLGQCFAVGFPGPKMSQEFMDFLENYKIGNIILFEHNIESNGQLKELCSEIRSVVTRSTGHAPFIMIDQEGGAIVRLSDDAVNVPGAMALAAAGDEKNAYRAGQLTGKQLKALGINFDLAPDMDVNGNLDNPVIGVRSYGDDPTQVARFGMEMARGLLSENVMACAKHFPGHGDTVVDSHLSLPLVEKSREELETMELLPFRQAARENIPAIMSSHILYLALDDRKIPATMSDVILTGTLRKELGFRGLILSDCMEMGAIRKYYGTAEGVRAAFVAGVDIVLVSHTASAAADAFDLVKNALEQGKMPAQWLDEAVERILSYKELYAGAGPEGDVTEKDKEEAYGLLKKTVVPYRATEKTMPRLGEKPLFAGCYAFRITLAANAENKKLCFPLWMKEKLGGDAIVFSPDPSEEEIRMLTRQAKGHSCIVMGTYNGHLCTGQLKLAEKLAGLGIPMIVFALRNPYDLAKLPDTVAQMAVWECSTRSFRAISEILEGKWFPSGKMPVRLRK